MKIEDILADNKHRPFGLPPTNWVYYQEWNHALFLHWKVPVDLLRKLVPKKLQLDLFDGDAYVSLVAFTMQKVRPRGLPHLGFVSDFDEVNTRTYIDNDNKKGVYFLSIEAQKRLSAFISRNLSGLPYQKSSIQCANGHYHSSNTQHGFYFDVDFEVKEKITAKTALDLWLTERYCAYLDKGEEVYRYDIHHREWEISHVALQQLKMNYTFGELSLQDGPELAHYSEGVQVMAWKKLKV